MKNVKIDVQGDKLLIEVDLTQSFGLSGSGKSLIIGSSEGNVAIPGREDIKLGLNIYKSAK